MSAQQANAQQAAGGKAVTLDEITVSGKSGDERGGKGAVKGLVAKTSTAGSKTATPIIETPQAITVIGRDRIDTFNPTSANEVFRYTPGISADVYGADQRSDNYLTIRGLDANFYQDGLLLPITRPYGSYRVDPWTVERVEILRGPASILYGQGGPGGTVNYVSKRPTGDPVHVIEGQVGTMNFARLAIDQGGAFDKDGVWSYRVNTLVNRTDLLGGDPFTGQRQLVNPSLAFRPDANTSFVLLSSYLRDNTSTDSNFLPSRGTVLPNPNGQISRYQWTGDRSFDSYIKGQWSIGYEAEHRFSSAFTVRQNLRYANVDTFYEAVYGAGLSPVTVDPTQRILNRFAIGDVVTSRALTIDNQAETNFDIGPTKHKLLVGVDYLNQKSTDDQSFRFAGSLDLYSGVGQPIPPQTPINVRGQDQRLTQVGLYIQDQVKVFDKLVITGGVRRDQARNDFRDDNASGLNAAIANNNQFSPRVGAVYLFDNGLAPYASYTQSFALNAGARSAASGLSTGMPFAPSVGKQTEAGVRYVPPGTNHQLTASVFDITQTNSVSGFGLAAFAQDLRSRGAELEALLQFETGARVIASYTRQRVRVTGSMDFPESVGFSPVAVPGSIAQLFSDYTFQTGPLKGFRFGGGVRYNGTSYGGIDDDGVQLQSIDIKPFAIFDAVLAYEHGPWRYSVNGSNIFNRKYVAACAGQTACFYGAPGRVVATARYTW